MATAGDAGDGAGPGRCAGAGGADVGPAAAAPVAGETTSAVRVATIGAGGSSTDKSTLFPRLFHLSRISCRLLITWITRNFRFDLLLPLLPPFVRRQGASGWGPPANPLGWSLKHELEGPVPHEEKLPDLQVRHFSNVHVPETVITTIIITSTRSRNTQSASIQGKVARKCADFIKTILKGNY